MNQILIDRICQSVVERYKKDKNVLGIMLFGSAARGKFDAFSDVDIFVLLNRKSKISRRNFVRSGLRVDIIFNTKKEVATYLRNDARGLRRITSNMLSCGKILYRKGTVLGRSQSVAKKNMALKTRYDAEKVLMHKYSIDDFWGEVQRDAKNEDYLAFGLDSQLLVENIIELFLEVNGGFLKQPNEMSRVITAIDHNFAVRLEEFYRAKSVQSKKKLLGGLVKDIYRKSGGPLPRQWTLKG